VACPDASSKRRGHQFLFWLGTPPGRQDDVCVQHSPWKGARWSRLTSQRRASETILVAKNLASFDNDPWIYKVLMAIKIAKGNGEEVRR